MTKRATKQETELRIAHAIEGANILGDHSTLQFKTNTSIEGVITFISLTSGTVIAYRL